MKTIIWDVDDVLNDLMREWIENWWRPAHPECTIAYDAITQNPPHRVLGISLAEYRMSLDAFRFAEGARLKPIPEVLSWFQEYGSHCRHITLTSVPLCASDISAAWVLKYFGQWIRSFNVIPSPRREDVIPVYDQTKKDFLEWWGKADILIDDNPVTVEAAHTLEITGLLMPSPWNKSQTTRASVLKSLTELVG
jgi:hypothetical protein